ncbi:putative PurR-regulated permease PerM [Winogradskyella epiphytica]|uniref:Putative PurR-regulated permease PerM n=1 Tax=Winogradskyella epiphytica TaxID=262005 RepID=A0A2V4WWZ7_9FLAO|nr:AI-2E family transporter [Winogradskyella epiphytica]PYE81776.1 putative PurR-regulated permease PerM [Winogradskyella epiphytica]GGW62757.1 AI-2E family transporter [Winogradskyella epiphytica]
MNSKIIANGILRALGVILATALVLFFLYKIQSVIVYIAIAVVISLIGRPIIIFLKHRLKFNNIVAVITTIILLLGLLIGLIGLFIPLIIEQGHNLALLNIEQLQSNIERLYDQIITYFQINNFDVEQSIKDSNLVSMLDFAIIPNFLNSLVSGLGSFSIGLFSVLFISFFFLKDSKLFEEGLMTFIPSGKEERSRRSINTIKDLLSRYFVGLIFQILILFVIYTIVLLIFGINNAIVIAFLCALLNLVPYIGPLVSGFLMLLLSMSSNLGESFSEVILPKTMYVMIGFIFAQLVDNFFSQPFIFSKSVKSHPLEIFLIIIIAGILFGVVGMIVAIPTYTAIKVILKEFLSDYNIVKKLTKGL